MLNRFAASGTTLLRRLASIFLIASIALVAAPNFLWLLLSDNQFFDHSRAYALMSGVVPACSILLVVLAVLGDRLWLAALLLAPFVAAAPIELAYITEYHEPTWYAILGTIVESNSREALDFLGGMVWVLAACVLLAALLAIGSVVLTYRIRLAWRGRIRELGLVIGVCVLVILIVFAYRVPLRNNDGHSLAVRLPAWADSFEPSYPAGVVIRSVHYWLAWRDMKAASEQLRDFRYGASAAGEARVPEIFILVIGEASRSDRWQIYGYGRNTNPELSQIQNLVTLNDVITPQDVSRMSVPIIVSRKRGRDARPFFDEPSISRVFSEAGFDTYWMSNQLSVGEYDSPISVVAYDAQHVSFHNIADWGNVGNFDEVLLRPLQRAIDTGSKRLFVVLHTLGSHANYAFRYPDLFDVYKPSLKGIPSADYRRPDLAEQISNSYDNSILYTDHFLSEVIRTLERTQAISAMWYVADHGEDLISDDCKLTGHGNGTARDYRVPSVLWYSNQFAEHFPQRVEQLRAHASEHLSTENVFESLVDMAGLTFPGHDSSWSIFSPAWKPHQRFVTSPVELNIDGPVIVSKKCQMFLPAG